MTKNSLESPTLPGLTKKGAATRAKILDVARELLIARGHHGLVMREVASQCGVKLGTVQYYFASHEDLVIRIIEAEGARDVETVRQSMEERDLPDRERVRELVEELITRWSRESAMIYSTLLLLALQGGAFRALYERIYESFYEALISAMKQVRPGLDETEYDLRARIMTSLIDGAAIQANVSRSAGFMDRIVEEACSIALSEESATAADS